MLADGQKLKSSVRRWFHRSGNFLCSPARRADLDNFGVTQGLESIRSDLAYWPYGNRRPKMGQAGSTRPDKAADGEGGRVKHGTQNDGSLKGSAATDTSVGGYPLADLPTLSPAFTVDGIPAIPGETWRAYHDRALAWITIESRTIPANRRYLSLWHVAGVMGSIIALGYLIAHI
ncbi:hypothetical protein BH10PSE12_BH10PSE12_36390 [soil metagenome]